MIGIQISGIRCIIKQKKNKCLFSTYQKYRKYYGNLKFKTLRPDQYNSLDLSSNEGLDVMFLGTSANMPTKTRSASCIGLNVNHKVWLFDCGEGSLKNIQASVIKSTMISKIFITHMHGDHVLGLPSLLMSLNNMDKEIGAENKIEVYGPRGLEEYLISTFKCLGVSYMLQNVSINEIPPMFSNNGYTVYEDSNMIVKATFIEHTCPCLGYVIEEKLQLNNAVSKYIERNHNELSNYLSSTYPSSKLSISNQNPFKIVILGDTNNAESVRSICTNPNILVHECTLLSNSYFNKYNSNGHSNAQMAGQLAKLLNAQNLVLTHFSRKLNKLDAKEYNNIFDSAYQEFQSKSIILAHDNLVLSHVS